MSIEWGNVSFWEEEYVKTMFFVKGTFDFFM